MACIETVTSPPQVKYRCRPHTPRPECGGECCKCISQRLPFLPAKSVNIESRVPLKKKKESHPSFHGHICSGTRFAGLEQWLASELGLKNDLEGFSFIYKKQNMPLSVSFHLGLPLCMNSFIHFSTQQPCVGLSNPSKAENMAILLETSFRILY